MSTYKEFLQGGGEKKWQDQWLSKKIDRAEDFSDQPKKYVLDMFPYPSGAGLHVGHPEGYTATDIYSRYWRLKGYNVLHPMGWDAFGLPAENYAIKTGTHPRATTEANIATFKRQIQSLGFSYDWDREIDTTDPNYYKWTQWIFLQLFKHGLAYEATVPINFCPSCKTGLANEEVRDSKCDRCGSEVERQDMRQWMLRITAYADRLLAGLDRLDWPESIKALQRNWIGRSEGAEVTFKISPPYQGGDKEGVGRASANPTLTSPWKGEEITVYTTRPDTLFGATYMVLAPEHPLIKNLESRIKNIDEVNKYINAAKNKSDLERTELAKEKTGVELKGIKAINPVNNEEIPVWISDYVLASYGTGAIMAVPAHDERDWEFARKFDLPIIDVIRPVYGEKHENEESRRTVSAVVHRKKDNNFLIIKWKQFGWISPVIGGIDEGETPEQAAEREVLEETGYKAKAVEKLGGEIESHFFADNKNVWRERFDQPVLLELVDDNPAQLSDEENARHEAVWMSGDEAIKNITHKYNAVGLQRHLAKNHAYTDVDEGVMINSEFLSGLAPAEAIVKMTAWLEEKGFGKKAVNYKLRDWVFSRQRYWGEPMPIVYCQSCKNKKQKVLLIHGFEGSGEGNWFPWIKEQFEKEGFEVFNPTITTSAHPEIDSWLEELMPYMDQLGENDIIIGHSLGAKAALLLLQQAKRKIGHVFLIAPALNPATDEEYERFRIEWGDADIKKLKKFLSIDINWRQIDALVNDKQAIYSRNDPYIKAADAQALPAGWCRQIWPGFRHFQKKEISELWDMFKRAKNTGWLAISENELPLQLPEIDKYEPTGTGESPLVNIADWVNTNCPVCGGPAKRETNTMPQWAGSSWYWLRYLDPQNSRELADKEKMKYWLPVDVYLGGAEHAVLHLLYARFWNMALYDIGAVPQEEPFAKLVNQGLILGEDGEKMSKSRGNVINPDDILAVHGADAFRMYEMFMGPLEQMKPWSTQGMIGIDRFLEKVWNLANTVIASEAKQSQGNKSEIAAVVPPMAGLPRNDNGELEILFNKTIKKVGEDIEKMSFNTAISAMMILVNKLIDVIPAKAGIQDDNSRISSSEYGNQAENDELKSYFEKFLIILSSFAPHLSEELWSSFAEATADESNKYHKSIFMQTWPVYDESKIKDETMEMPVQINGKVRAKLILPADISEDGAVSAAKADENVSKYLEGRTIKKVIFVKGKLLSFVI